MNWTRSETVALAASHCVFCSGLGLRPARGRFRHAKLVACRCVFRAIFRVCYKRFKSCVARPKHLCHVTGEIYGTGGQRRMVWGRKIEEYIADFYLISKRTLTPREWRVFQAHFLLGADWRLCCRQLAISKGDFFHLVYSCQEKLGRAFREISPYSLFPLDEYFKSTLRWRNPASLWEAYWARDAARTAHLAPKVVPIRPPLRPRPVPPGSAPAPLIEMPVRPGAGGRRRFPRAA